MKPGPPATTVQTISDDDIDTSRGLLYRVSLSDGSMRLMRDLRRMFLLCHAWFDTDTQKIVALTWLVTRGQEGATHIRFSDFSGGELTPAFGGAIVDKMDLAIDLGDSVSWAVHSGDQWRVKMGVVEEIVPMNCLPDRTRFPQLFRSTGGGPRALICPLFCESRGQNQTQLGRFIGRVSAVLRITEGKHEVRQAT